MNELPLIGTQHQECQNPGFGLELLQTPLLPETINNNFASTIREHQGYRVNSSCTLRLQGKALFTYPCTFTQIKSSSTNKKPKTTIGSPTHVLNSSCNRSVMWLPEWLKNYRQGITVNTSALCISHMKLKNLNENMHKANTG